MQTLELLAPAKNLECGIAAIDHGADAVYMVHEQQQAIRWKISDSCVIMLISLEQRFMLQ